MRRQARVTAGTPRTPRTASALQAWLWLLIFIFQNEACLCSPIKPGYLDFDNLPETNFTCEGKVIGGYYADLETSCQMFHVCTVGQHEEPMDIKFLCLNGTVFDQETRVCERVDEVDCTKSEKFYSLNLELYGNTAPPIIQPSPNTPKEKDSDYESGKKNHNNTHSQEFSQTIDNKEQILSFVKDTTESSTQFPKKHEFGSYIDDETFTNTASENLKAVEDDDLADTENSEYEDDYNIYTTTSSSVLTTTRLKTTSRVPNFSTTQDQTYSNLQSATPFAIHTSTKVTQDFQNLPVSKTSEKPSIFSPQEFISLHRDTGSEAISFQHHGFRHTNGVFITHPPVQEYDQMHYELSRTAPRPIAPIPTTFVNRPQPSPFKTTTYHPKDQLLRPGPTSQPSERHETSIKHGSLKSPLFQRLSPFDTFYYENKRFEDHSSHTARSASPFRFNLTARQTHKPKNPPRVIVTASASVSDSNGKRLNYTVGNVVNAVKPIVPINYDDYKESDLIFDPFFLDVPKLKNYRKSRSSKREIINLLFNNYPKNNNFSAVNSTFMMNNLNVTKTNNTGPANILEFNPSDYVDDNYEPLVYIPPVHSISTLISHKPNNDNKKKTNISPQEEFMGKSNDTQSRQEIQNRNSFIKNIKSSSQKFNSAISHIVPSSVFTIPVCTKSSTSYICKNRI